jgi:hypothetical protein
MPPTSPDPEAILFMKVGNEPGETLEAIVERKIKEEETAGVTFWGYGGTLCHPRKVVQPFLAGCCASGLPIQVMMSRTNSELRTTRTIAQECSVDKRKWCPIPNGIMVTTSRYALVLRHFRRCEFEIDIANYVVAYGPKKNTPFNQYIRYHVDKGVATRLASANASERPIAPISISFVADLVKPYAIFVR